MFSLISMVLIRTFSNSYLNVFQKILTNKDESASIVNFFTYLGLTILGIIFCHNIIFSASFLPHIFTMGFLGALGNYYIVKALSCGELSALAPINSYKPIIAMIIGFFLLNEIPNFIQFLGILLIISGTFLLKPTKVFFNKATLYRFIALILLGTEAIFIKKIILLSNINSTFLYWVIAGLIFSGIFAILSKHKIKIKKENIKYQLALITTVAIMQYSTTYVFAKMNVAYALALFQLSTILSVFLGINIFKERGFLQKAIASTIMIIGAVIITINNG